MQGALLQHSHTMLALVPVPYLPAFPVPLASVCSQLLCISRERKLKRTAPMTFAPTLSLIHFIRLRIGVRSCECKAERLVAVRTANDPPST
ncbi:hypothetical protein DFJ73DRAFT_810911 [Zopfochytrium polystomum]|nr:hypothetical protein DFJ73DRAFT_810911 [Zopfochytrium polystomum]